MKHLSNLIFIVGLLGGALAGYGYGRRSAIIQEQRSALVLLLGAAASIRLGEASEALKSTEGCTDKYARSLRHYDGWRGYSYAFETIPNRSESKYRAQAFQMASEYLKLHPDAAISTLSRAYLHAQSVSATDPQPRN